MPKFTGTGYFDTQEAAIKYHTWEAGLYGVPPESVPEIVESYLKEGYIHIGKPPLREGQSLLLDDEGRYYFKSNEP